ncbi:MAG: hypothetical protein CW338_04675 [Clostridiales bacterium]|nr:hypothetical protein [Clostridiales bacterium]
MNRIKETGRKNAGGGLRFLRLLCFALCLFMLPLYPAVSQAQEYAADGTVRVWLSSLNSPLSVQLTIRGTYYVNNDSSFALKDGSTVVVKIDSKSGKLTLVTDAGTRSMGTAFTLVRKNVDEFTGVKIAQARKPGNLYPADFTFTSVSDSGSYVLYAIASMYIEDYLCGVVPYEIGDSSPVEALKAMAVVGRTYVMRKKKGTSSRIYDVVDTPTDQVYNGTYSGYTRSKQAVLDTKGIVLLYKGSFAATFCTASNGGQTEAAVNAWGGTGYDYLTVKDDPYDLVSAGKKKSFVVSSGAKQSNSTLNTLLTNKLKKLYGSGASLSGIYEIEFSEPRYPAPSRLYMKMTFFVTYTINGASRYGELPFEIFSELESQLGMDINSSRNELWYADRTASGWTVTARRSGHGIGMSQYGAIEMGNAGLTFCDILGFYFSGCDQVTYTLTGRDSALHDQQGSVITARVNTVSSSLNLRYRASTSAAVLIEIPKNTIIEITERGDEWCHTSYRGHDGYVMTKYLDFDYPVMQRTAAPASTPTAAPTATQTAAPVQTPQTVQNYGRVNTSSSSLNLRQTVGGKVIGYIPRGTVIPLLELTGSWYRTTYNGKSGYVSKTYIVPLTVQPLQTPDAVQTAAPVPTPSAAALTAKVNTSSGSLNLRSSGSTSGRILRTIPKGATVTVLEKGGTWSRISYSGTTGYVMSKYLIFAATPKPTATPKRTATAKPTATPKRTATPKKTATPTPTAAPTYPPESGEVYAVVVTSGGTLNMRSAPQANAGILCYIPFCTRIRTVQKGALWSLVQYGGYTGYVMTSYLAFENGAVPDSDVPAPGPGALREKGMKTLTNPVYATVASSSGSLNLRAGCSTSSVVLMEIPRYSRVIVTAIGSTWCEVQYGSRSGFCMRKYISFAD